MSYFSLRIDGAIRVAAIRVGIVKMFDTLSPAARFYIHAGYQTHPVLATDQLAFTVYSYYAAAVENKRKAIDASIEGNLLSGELSSVIWADEIVWHVSNRMRGAAERNMLNLLAKMNGQTPKNWPRELLPLPDLEATKKGSGSRQKAL